MKIIMGGWWEQNSQNALRQRKSSLPPELNSIYIFAKVATLHEDLRCKLAGFSSLSPRVPKDFNVAKRLRHPRTTSVGGSRVIQLAIGFGVFGKTQPQGHLESPTTCDSISNSQRATTSTGTHDDEDPEERNPIPSPTYTEHDNPGVPPNQPGTFSKSLSHKRLIPTASGFFREGLIHPTVVSLSPQEQMLSYDRPR
ncbi:hypothetical protein KEM54_001771 [Ascosphaera aggregata]|nr:hypothetical protein KEM54_001771 [Ascosphaera aggregata]